MFVFTGETSVGKPGIELKQLGLCAFEKAKIVGVFLTIKQKVSFESYDFSMSHVDGVRYPVIPHRFSFPSMNVRGLVRCDQQTRISPFYTERSK